MSGIVRRQRRRKVLTYRPQVIRLLGLHPGFSLESVEEDEASDETEVEENNDNDGGDYGGLGTADVARIADILNCSILGKHSAHCGK